MLLLVYLSSLLLLVQGEYGIFDGMCPVPECYCGLDPRGRLEVSCTTGNLNEIPTSRMSPSIQVIKITPDKKNNHLTIGRNFRQFKKIQEIHLISSGLDSLGDGNFRDMKTLKLLNLSGNVMLGIVDSNFIGLSSLEMLILSKNKLEKFVSGCFEPLTSLKYLDLSGNRIVKLIERIFYNLHMLEILDLSFNKLEQLNADVFRDIWRLKEFKCKQCQLKIIPTLLYSLLPALKRLDLSDNRLLKMEELGLLKSLEWLNLSGNEIRTVGEESFRSVRLRWLSLSRNGLKEIERSAFQNASVYELDLSGNNFETLNKLVFLDMNCTRLDLSLNRKLKLSSLLIILSENPQLKWLSVAKNNYQDLPLDLFEDNRPLQFLNLSYNNIKELFPRIFTPLLSLQYLDISFNKIKGLEQDLLNTFDRISTIREIKLQGNPFACDLCHILPLHKWIRQSPIFTKGCVTSPNGPFCLRCRWPSRLKDESVLSLDESVLEWCDPYGDEYGSETSFGLFLVIGLLFLLLVVILVGLFLRYQFWYGADYYTHEDNRASTPPPLVQDYYATINGTHTKVISTIDEKNFNPDTNFYPDLK